MEERINRLVGGGKSEGGGMPLPSLFRIVLDLIQVHGTCTIDELKGPVEQEIRKPERLATIYPGERDRWAAFVRDGLEQLQARGFVKGNGAGWSLGEKFVTGERLIVIPARKDKNRDVWVLTFPPSEWAEREQAEKHKLAITSAVAKLRRTGVGLRPLDEKRVAVLVESMRQFGWNAAFPVLVDQEDRILDGRHRLEAAKRAEVQHTEKLIKVKEDAEALVIAWLANESKSWSEPERRDFAKLLTASDTSHGAIAKVLRTGGRPVPPEVRAEIEDLLLNTDLTYKAITKKVRCGHKIIYKVRDALTASGVTVPNRPDGHKPPVPEEKIIETLQHHPEWSDRKIARELGCAPDGSFVRTVRKKVAAGVHSSYPLDNRLGRTQHPEQPEAGREAPRSGKERTGRLGMEKSQVYWSFEAKMETLAREFGRSFTFDEDAVDEIVKAMRAWWSRTP